MPKIIIYSTPSCTYCVLAKEFFKKNNVDYIDYNVAEDVKKREEMIKKSGQMGVPVIDVDGEIIIGFDKPRLIEKLNIRI